MPNFANKSICIRHSSKSNLWAAIVLVEQFNLEYENNTQHGLCWIMGYPLSI